MEEAGASVQGFKRFNPVQHGLPQDFILTRFSTLKG